MGVYYFYVNATKQEYFCIDPTYQDIKQYALGDNIGSRALSYLLLQNDHDYTDVESHPRVGSWIGDHFFVTGDDYCPDFEKITSEYADIGQAVLEMLVEIAPHDLYQYGGPDWLIFQMDNNGEGVTVTDAMRRRLLKYYRQVRQEQHSSSPDDPLDKVIAALRPKE